MNCGYSKEILALYIEDDLPTTDHVRHVASHIASCAACQQYCDALRRTQSLIKSRFKAEYSEPVSQTMLAGIRHNVMSRIDATQQSFSLAMRLERFLMAGLKRRRYAAAGFVFAAVLSISLLGQIRYAAEQPGRLIFTAEHTLVQPAGYREWIFAGSSLGPGCSANDWTEAYHNVYVSPAAYREYAHSGRFPDGTVIVKETLSVESMKDPGFRGSYEKDLIGLKVSVKDSSRFGDGWGFYDFTEPTGDTRSETQLLPQTAGCISCHRDRGATDHVFTQFYPVLRGIGS